MGFEDFRIWGFRVYGVCVGLRVWGLGFRFLDLGVWDLGLRVWDLEFHSIKSPRGPFFSIHLGFGGWVLRVEGVNV